MTREFALTCMKNYSEFVVEDHKDWAMARRTAGLAKTYTVRYRPEYADVLNWGAAIARRLARKLGRGGEVAATGTSSLGG